MNDRKKNNVNMPLVLMVLAGIFLLAFVLKRVFLFVLLFLVVFGTMAAVYYFVKLLSASKKPDPSGNKITEGLQKNLGFCEEQIGKNSDEIEKIEKEIAEIQDKLDADVDIRDVNREESRQLIKEFSEQLNLRKTRLTFYQTCKEKLHTVLHNYELRESLLRKRKLLENLKKNKYDDIAKMESLKHELAFEEQYMETIERLSLRMLESTDVDDAAILQLELDEMTRELRKL